jgi:hypothetical protein
MAWKALLSIEAFLATLTIILVKVCPVAFVPKNYLIILRTNRANWREPAHVLMSPKL